MTDMICDKTAACFHNTAGYCQLSYQMDKYSTNKSFKEGGIGWVIVGSCFILGLITMDVCGSIGIFMIECSERYVSL